MEKPNFLSNFERELCEVKECEPPYGGKENCEFYKQGVCSVKTTGENWFSLTKKEK